MGGHQGDAVIPVGILDHIDVGKQGYVFQEVSKGDQRAFYLRDGVGVLDGSVLYQRFNILSVTVFYKAGYGLDEFFNICGS